MPRPAPANRTDFKFLSSLPTRWMDNDQYGHMNNVVHYSLFDTAVSNWQMAQGGFNVTGEVTKLMVVESGCRYFDEAGYPDLIHVGLRLGHLGNSSWRYDRVVSQRNQHRLCRGFLRASSSRRKIWTPDASLTRYARGARTASLRLKLPR